MPFKVTDFCINRKPICEFCKLTSYLTPFRSHHRLLFEFGEKNGHCIFFILGLVMIELLSLSVTTEMLTSEYRLEVTVSALVGHGGTLAMTMS